MILKNKIQTNSSDGVLSKGVYSNGIKNYLVKGNSEYGYLEPYSEVMASIIANKLGIKHVEYKLGYYSQYMDIKTYGNCEHVSICEILPYNIYQYMKFFDKPNVDISTIDFYLEQNLSKEYLISMLLFDAFIGNRDRHFNNFDIYFYNGELVNAPLLDSGSSLLYHIIDSDLEIYDEYDIGPDTSKPFESTHKRQIELLKVYFGEKNMKIFPKLNKENFLEDLFSEFENEGCFDIFTNDRIASLKSYLTVRFDEYIKPYMINNTDKRLSWI